MRGFGNNQAVRVGQLLPLTDVELRDAPDALAINTHSKVWDGGQIVFSDYEYVGRSLSECRVRCPDPYTGAPATQHCSSAARCGGRSPQRLGASRIVETPGLSGQTQPSNSISAVLSAKAYIATEDDVIAPPSAAAHEAHEVAQVSQARPTPENNLSSNRTTIMLCNLPLRLSRSKLLEVLDSEGFAGCYDFVYLPHNFETCLCFGYTFVNLVSPDHAELARRHFQGFIGWTVPCEKPCETGWGEDPCQGFDANVKRYRNSPVMHAHVADEFKPILFAGGVRQVFPAPTRLIRAPKWVRRSVPVQAARGLSPAPAFTLMSL